MEVAQMLMAHSILVKAFLGFLVIGVIASLFTKSGAGFKKLSFIYTMVFQAVITMMAFAGFVAIFTGDLGWAISTIIMMVVWGFLMFIEIKKHKLIKVANLESAETFKVIKKSFIQVGLVQIFVVVIMVVLMILKAKGVISL